MDKIITDFGVQPVYLAAQAFNFIILFLVLKRFLYPSILKILEDRQKKVSDSLQQAEEINQKLQQTEQEAAKRLSNVSLQAKKIIENATITADQIVADAYIKVQADIEKGRQDIEAEREVMRNKVSEELGDLVIQGVKSVSGKLLDHPDHLKIVEKTVQTLKDERLN